MKSSRASWRMYSPLKWASFFRSKNALDALTSSRRNSSTISLSGRISTPTERGEVVHHRFGQVATVDVVTDRDVVATLRQLLALLVHDQREVGEHGDIGDAESLAQQQHLRRDVDEILAPNDVGDAHGRIVDGVGNEEHRQAAAADDDEVLEVGVLERHLAADQVVERCGSLVGGAKADDDAGAGLDVTVAAEAVVTGWAAGLLVAGLDRVLGAVAAVGRAVGEELLGCGDVVGQAIALVDGFAVEVDAEPVEGGEDRLDQLGLAALGVGVLDPQEHLPAHVAGEEPVEQRRAGTSDVEVSRRGGGESDANVGGRHPASVVGGPTPSGSPTADLERRAPRFAPGPGRC